MRRGGKKAIRLVLTPRTIQSKPDVMFTPQAVFQWIENAEDDKERFVNMKALEIGF